MSRVIGPLRAFSKTFASAFSNNLPDANWLIVGLGNPGASYEKTRHNLGFMLVDLLAREFQTQVKRDECRSLIGRAEIETGPDLGRVVDYSAVKGNDLVDGTGEVIVKVLKESGVARPNRFYSALKAR